MDSNELETDILTLIDDEGAEHEFEVLDCMKYEGKTYYALIPAFLDTEEEEEIDGTYYIFEAVTENGENQLAEVEDDETLEKLSQIFESKFQEYYQELEEE